MILLDYAKWDPHLDLVLWTFTALVLVFIFFKNLMVFDDVRFWGRGIGGFNQWGQGRGRGGTNKIVGRLGFRGVG